VGCECADVRGEGLRLLFCHWPGCSCQMLYLSYTACFPFCKLMHLCTKAFHIDCTMQPHTRDLEDRQDVRRRSDATGDIDRLADNEELIPFSLLTMLSQCFEVEELTNWHAPAGEHDLVTRPLFLRWPRLPKLCQQKIQQHNQVEA
jgi:hypothetical protein